MTFQKDTQPATTAYDSKPPEALLEFMKTQWKPSAAKAPAKLKHAEAFRARRRALSALFPDQTLVIPTGHEKVRSNDTVFRFRPCSDFYYLSGNTEPDCVLVMVPQEGGHRDLLFVEPNPGRSDATFYTDRVKGELWVGPRLGVDASMLRYGVDACRGLPELKEFLSTEQAARPFLVLRGFSPAVDAVFP
ncbi:MAG TPA: aminopeptidase P N-terminal domain-containing protein, partial [Myxococcaceae bacterium]|nr:aminopeptidase P N-terminal domain-containing protein [Myxococcaceae bacterium]